MHREAPSTSGDPGPISESHRAKKERPIGEARLERQTSSMLQLGSLQRFGHKCDDFGCPSPDGSPNVKVHEKDAAGSDQETRQAEPSADNFFQIGIRAGPVNETEVATVLSNTTEGVELVVKDDSRREHPPSPNGQAHVEPAKIAKVLNAPPTSPPEIGQLHAEPNRRSEIPDGRAYESEIAMLTPQLPILSRTFHKGTQSPDATAAARSPESGSQTTPSASPQVWREDSTGSFNISRAHRPTRPYDHISTSKATVEKRSSEEHDPTLEPAQANADPLDFGKFPPAQNSETSSVDPQITDEIIPLAAPSGTIGSQRRKHDRWWVEDVPSVAWPVAAIGAWFIAALATIVALGAPTTFRCDAKYKNAAFGATRQVALAAPLWQAALIDDYLPRLGGYDCALARPSSSGQRLRLEVQILGPSPLQAPLTKRPCVLYFATAGRRLHDGVQPLSVACSSASVPFKVALADTPQVHIHIRGEDVALFAMVGGQLSAKKLLGQAPDHWRHFVNMNRSSNKSDDFSPIAALEFQECALLVGAVVTVVGELHRGSDGNLTLRPLRHEASELDMATMIRDQSQGDRKTGNNLAHGDTSDNLQDEVCETLASRVLVSDDPSLRIREEHTKHWSVRLRELLKFDWTSGRSEFVARRAG